jgi:hypothetical protein
MLRIGAQPRLDTGMRGEFDRIKAVARGGMIPTGRIEPLGGVRRRGHHESTAGKDKRTTDHGAQIGSE